MDRLELAVFAANQDRVVVGLALDHPLAELVRACALAVLRVALTLACVLVVSTAGNSRTAPTATLALLGRRRASTWIAADAPQTS